MSAQYVTYQQFMDFLKSKPGDTKVDMSKNKFNLAVPSGCGCLMVQYGLDRGMTALGCSWNGIYDHNDRTDFLPKYILDDISAKFVFYCWSGGIKTFQEAIDLERKMNS